MLDLGENKWLVEHPSELPRPAGRIKRLYKDYETTSGDDKLDSLNPWHHCYVAGVAVTWDDEPRSWYVPVGHRHGRNVPIEAVADWVCDLETASDCWVNHNVKYDMHVQTNALGVLPELPVVCTLTGSKIVDSDRFRRGLDELSVDWLGEDISRYQQAMEPWLHKCKDYGNVPPDVMGRYACQDVITNRRLDKYVRERTPAQCSFVRDMEIELTSVLFDMERVGLPVDPEALRSTQLDVLSQMQWLDEEMSRIVGRPFRAHVNEDCFEVLCGQYGLPVVEWTDSGAPSFDKHAMAAYSVHPYAPHHLVWLMNEFRHLNTLNSFFISKYLEVHVNGLLHSAYNQMVRTGRLSSKLPNAQQLSPAAKALIVALAGETFLSIDYSQIEFRTIVHYINDLKAVAAYNADPDTDFHRWVAELPSLRIQRKPAKTINFLVAFGGGKKKLLKALSSNMDFVGDIKRQVDAMGLAPAEAKTRFEHMALARAEQTFNAYHDEFPGIRRVSRHAAMTARVRGYVFNLAGRYRHLPKERAHIAFNTLNQGSAADLQKERTVALHKMLKGTPVKMCALVHDETLFRGPHEVMEDPRTIRDIVHVMESPHFPLRVPVRTAHGYSRKDWREACKGPCLSSGGVAVKEPVPLKYDKSEFGNLEHLR